MSLDVDDLTDPPFGLGECVEKTLNCRVSCDTWDETEKYVRIRLRRRGGIATIHIPELLYNSKVSGRKNYITIETNLTSESDGEEWLWENAEKIVFTGVGFNGCSRNSDRLTNEACICLIEMRKNGTIYISPLDDYDGFTVSIDGDQIGLLSFTFSYIPSIVDEQDEKNEPSNKVPKN